MTKTVITDLVDELALEEFDSLKARAKEGLRVLNTKAKAVRITIKTAEAKQEKIDEQRDKILTAYKDGDEVELERLFQLEL